MEGVRRTARPRVPTRDEYAAALAGAVDRSPLSRFPVDARRTIVASGMRLDVAARTLMYREGEPPFNAIVVRGTFRIFMAARDGREFTLLWARPGEWIGYALIAGGPMELSAQALTDASVHVLPVAPLETLARSQAPVAWELARLIAARLAQANALLRMLAFMDLRQRLAQRLLELAFRQQPGTALVAPVTQQQLADLIGSPRTSVARALADLRDEGLVRTVRGGIELVRPERLAPDLAALSVA